jgi:hypothetical protein
MSITRHLLGMGMEMLSMYISSYLSAHTILKFKFKVKIGETNLRAELLFINIFCALRKMSITCHLLKHGQLVAHNGLT